MGLFLSRLSKLFEDWGTSQARILMLGLDAAGKTTVLYKLKLNETVSTIPTIGFNVETVAPVKGLSFTVWDVGGQEVIRPLCRHYYPKLDGLIYAIDSADRERMSEARKELFHVLESDETKGVPLLIIANKQDLPNALDRPTIIEQLNLNKLTRSWHVQPACATTGDGIIAGMQELAVLVKGKKK
ncbi:uncharacterized protein LOC128546128 [Mercenaria mercenaria]|uniref:uncharacterized protein LOC128546128 n=1 Tax=Mercenaria mercenaria TaxID=6596 RepID=UPI00234EC3F6|nr:uncharacterized protein LOC128546128 [Mercenaria mercenaria]